MKQYRPPVSRPEIRDNFRLTRFSLRVESREADFDASAALAARH
jgi:hypothetical protein